PTVPAAGPEAVRIDAVVVDAVGIGRASLAVPRAAVAGRGERRIALLAELWFHDPVAARVAVVRAQVGVDRVAVVTLLRRAGETVSARGRLAEGAAAVAVVRVAVVAGFAARRVHHAVAARAVAAAAVHAAVAVLGIAVVAHLGRAGHAGPAPRVALAIVVTAVAAVDRVPVVALLGATHRGVAAARDHVRAVGAARARALAQVPVVADLERAEDDAGLGARAVTLH